VLKHGPLCYATPSILIHTVILPLIFFAQTAAVADPIYSTQAVRDLVNGAVIANHAPPAAFAGYRAHVESEFSILLRDTLGRERTAQVEQLASAVHWTRGERYDMHVIGYRTQSIGSLVSMMSFVNGWTEPSLYGERLTLGVQILADTLPARRRPRSGAIIAVHPFAADREQYYRYSGGDTVVVMHTLGRTIPIVRVHVTPHLRDSTRFAAFDGEIDLDADRRQIVRMRGQFVVLGNSKQRRLRISRVPGLVAVAYCEFVNAEIQGRYWLPAFQRTELQTTFALFGNMRAVMRVVSRFSDHDIEDTRDTTAHVDDGNSIPHRTTWAPSDSVSHFRGWSQSLGDATSDVTADDFDDVAPDKWKQTGGARLDLSPTKTDNMVRYDRVEGMYTGIEANLRMRSVVPGLTAGTIVGWAWTEQTFRGGAHISLRRDPWTVGARGERTLATTNDFIRPLEPQSGGVAAMFGSVDDFDYVDRRVALGSLTRVFGAVDRGLLTLQLGFGDDRAEHARLTHGLFGGGSFRPNRGVTEGTYALAVGDIELHPNASGESLQPGIGAALHYEGGRGQLDWQRSEISIFGTKYLGPVTVTADGDGGVVWGAVIPPQQLFELGGSGVLPGYTYKEFAGDRAALLRTSAFYAFPVWRSPHRLWRTLFIPGVGPGVAGGLQGGWTALSTDAARAAVGQLGAGSAIPISRATGGFRATLGLGVTLFSGAAHLGFARPVDHQAGWRFVGGLGRSF
jgi:hypothetical protein